MYSVNDMINAYTVLVKSVGRSQTSNSKNKSNNSENESDNYRVFDQLMHFFIKSQTVTMFV